MKSSTGNWAALLVLCTLVGCTSAPRQAVFTGGAVAADHPVASEAGVRMLRLGGNAVDAAIAASFTLSVTDPFSCGVGGGGFMVVYAPPSDARPAVEAVLNYRETAPGALGPDFYPSLDRTDASRIGGAAVGVPGTVRGLEAAHQRWGTLPWPTLLAPAIEAAQQGVAVNEAWCAAARWLGEARSDQPHLARCSEWIWKHLCGSGTLQPGDVVRQPEQARLLRRIAGRGADFFYTGEVARDIALAAQAAGGVMQIEDIEGYSTQDLAPLVADEIFGRYRLLTMPPPSSGGVAEIQVLRMLWRRWGDLHDPGPDDPAYLHLLASAMQQAFADRARWLADGTFAPVPVSHLLSDAHVQAAADRIDPDRALEPVDAHVLPPPDDAGTSHLSVVDADGMAVACTETINTLWGSCVAVEPWGIVLNNEMDDFTTNPGGSNAFGLRQSDRNAPEPGKRPLSSMSPTIVLEGDEVRLVAGASGGPRIISATIKAIVDVLIFGMTPEEALAVGRVHQQWSPDVLWLEQGRFDESVHADLRSRGWDVRERTGMGAEQLLEVLPDGSMLPASDPRKGGAPAGVRSVTTAD
ncbi:MAG: gamma-glutamyltransferase [Phycisphaerales bacterium]|nr:gamma-glutamyltransferase [Phycisphaerales bacterium]